ncbi:MAG TPA: 4a-hydroxytetrahydrobiopterin dehydratase [Candidatus Obscuribacterales bacterium]
MGQLADRKCEPCRGGVPPLSEEDCGPLLAQLDGWTVEDGKRLVKSFRFKNFLGPMALAKRIADVAEREDHHPDLLVRWGELKVTLWTHKIDGLSENDFVLAAKIDRAASDGANQ